MSYFAVVSQFGGPKALEGGEGGGGEHYISKYSLVHRLIPLHHELSFRIVSQGSFERCLRRPR